jgi:hypothetical protein
MQQRGGGGRRRAAGRRRGTPACNRAAEGDAGVQPGGAGGRRLAAGRRRGTPACNRRRPGSGHGGDEGRRRPSHRYPPPPGRREKLRTPAQNSPGCLQSRVDSVAGIVWISFALVSCCPLDARWTTDERGRGTLCLALSEALELSPVWRGLDLEYRGQEMV